MNLQFQIRQFNFPGDYDATLRLWSGMEKGVRVGPSDTRAEIEKKLQRDPDLFLVAEMKSQIVGSVIGGYDGRRGMIYHLAVRSGLRKQGIATGLLGDVEKRLQAKGCTKSYLMVFADNDEAAEFYEHRGWRELKDDYFAALRALDLAGYSVEYVFVDNASCDVTAARLPVEAARLISPSRVLSEATPGLMFARCTGVAAAGGEFVLFLDDDNEPEPDYLIQLDRLLAAPIFVSNHANQ